MRITKRRLGYMLIALSCAMVVAAFFGFYGLFLPAIVPAFFGLGLLFGSPSKTCNQLHDDELYRDFAGLNGKLRQDFILGRSSSFLNDD